jgi:hypothetical protein
MKKNRFYLVFNESWSKNKIYLDRFYIQKNIYLIIYLKNWQFGDTYWRKSGEFIFIFFNKIQLFRGSKKKFFW